MGGLGGGGGPELDTNVVCGRLGGAGAFDLAYFPASGRGGGAANLRGAGPLGGECSRGGVGSRCTSSAFDLRGAGGAGGIPRFVNDEADEGDGVWGL